MGCGYGVEISKEQCYSSYQPDSHNLVQVGEYNGHQFSKYYYDNRREEIFIKASDKTYYYERILKMDRTKIIPLMSDNS